MGFFKEKIAEWLAPELREIQQTLFGNSTSYAAFGYDDIRELNERTQRDSYRGIFFRCLQIRANAIAKGMQDATVQRLVGEEWEDVESAHPWYKLIRQPSEILDAYNYWKWASLTRDLGSGAHSFVDYKGIMPNNLYPIYRDFGEVNPIPNRYGGIKGWKHIRNDGSIVNYEHNQVIRIYHQSPFSPYESVSLLQAGLLEIDTDRFMKLYRKDSVDEGGLTSVVLSSDQDLQQPQVDKYASEFKKKMGRRGKKEVAVLGKGLDVKNYGMSSKELEYVDGGRLTQDEIFLITGVPKGLYESVTTQATGKTAETVFAQYTVQPNLNDICSQYTLALQRTFESEAGMLRVKAPDVVPLDKEFELKQETEHIKHGVIKPSEVAQKHQYESEGIDEYLISNLPEEQPEPARMIRSVRNIDIDDYWKRIDEKKTELENKEMTEIRRMYDRFKVESINNLNEARQSRQDDFVVMVDEIMSEAELKEIIESSLRPEIIELIKAGFENAQDFVASDVVYSQSNPKVRDAIQAVLKNHFKIAETVHENLSKVVNELVSQKADFQDIVDTVQEFYPQEFAARGRTTAQTLTTNSFESGQQLLFEEAGIKTERWVSQRDGKVRPTHVNADGQEIKVSDTFQVGNSKLRYPGDPTGESKEVIGCRCTVFPVVD